MCQSQSSRELEAKVSRGQTRPLPWPSNSDLAVERQGCLVAQAGEVGPAAGENHAATGELAKIWVFHALPDQAEHLVQPGLQHADDQRAGNAVAADQPAVHGLAGEPDLAVAV